MVSEYLSELMIKEIPMQKDTLPFLVYKVTLSADHPDNKEFGYVDARTGKTLFTEPTLIDVSSIGTFTTRYNGIKQAHTDYVSGSYRLFDNTRGPTNNKTTIRTLSLAGSTFIPSNPGSSYELTDNDNNWTTSEHGPNNNNMALDIHWALQQIYDRLHNVHSISSYNNNSHPITAYIKYSSNYENAFWDGANNVMCFGVGGSTFAPLASIDLVAHEFGHGITQFQIGWGLTGNPRAFSEGLSDIWGAIMKYRFAPYQPTWMIGNQIIKTYNYNCIRDLQYTYNNNLAYIKIANTYNSSQFNNGNEYVKSGVFSHWFYLLVNGGYGKNALNNSYKVYGVGMDIAEKLIVKAVYGGYMQYVTSWSDLRTYMLNAAKTFDCNSQYGILTQQVDHAWYAVGVGLQPATQIDFTSTHTLRCVGETVTYSVSGFPVGTYTWSNSSNLTPGTTSGHSKPYTATGVSEGWVQINCDHGITIRKDIWVGVPVIYYIDGPTYVSPGYYSYEAKYNHLSAPYSLYWIQNESGVGYNYQTTASGYAGFTFYNDGMYQIVSQATNTCGQGGTTVLGVRVSRSSSSGSNVYPNPVLDVLYIELDPPSRSKTQITYDVRLLDVQGNLLRQTFTKGGTVEFNVSTLPDGVYYLHIYDGVSEKPEMHQIMVEH